MTMANFGIGSQLGGSQLGGSSSSALPQRNFPPQLESAISQGRDYAGDDPNGLQEKKKIWSYRGSNFGKYIFLIPHDK